MPATQTALTLEFDRQVQTLLDLGYPALAGLTPEAFAALLAPLRDQLAAHDSRAVASDPDRVPMVLVIQPELVAPEAAMPLTALKGKPGFADFVPDGFKPIEELAVPEGPAYLLFDVDTGTETLNVTPDDALVTIRAQGRTPLTIAEGIALITQFPEKLRKNRCFSLVGSRCDGHGVSTAKADRRVPALWISQGRPKLGWCWAGNPHTWLGSASCAGRG